MITEDKIKAREILKTEFKARQALLHTLIIEGETTAALNVVSYMKDIQALYTWSEWNM